MFLPSHYLVRVQNLHEAVADYEAAGFSVTWGSDPQRAHNAMIHFRNGGFLEIFNPRPPGAAGTLQKGVAAIGARLQQPLLVRLHRWQSSQGLCDYALESSAPLTEAAAQARQRGAQPGKIRDFSRRGADGIMTRWQICAAHSADLPFMMGPYDPTPQINEAQLTHANGIDQLRGMTLTTPNPKRYAEDLAALLGDAEIAREQDSTTVRCNAFKFVLNQGTEHRCEAMLTDHAPPPTAQLHGLRLLEAL
ncbi:MAG: VOC family protein [Pseudomonadota bacterium]